MQTTKNMMYLWCSEDLVNHFKPEEVSKPRLYYTDKTYIAYLDFDEVDKYYQSLDEIQQDSCFAQEVTSGTMGVEWVSKNKIKNNNIFKLIFNELNLSTQKNIALSIGSIASSLYLTPIEVFNISKKKFN